MDQFESIVTTLLEAESYWVRQSFKVNLSKEEKRQIGKPSIPRPEIDLLAMNFSENHILALEVKSYFDSPGVSLKALEQEFSIPEGRYKLFTSTNYRKVVFAHLKKQLVECGMANSTTRFSLGLAAGNVYRNQETEIRELFDKNGFLFWSPSDIKQKVEFLAQARYENNAAIIIAKILMR